MKVTTKTVQDRITILENLRTISINEEFQLACLRQLLASMNAPAVSLADLVPDFEEDDQAFTAGVNALIDCLEDCGDAEQGLRLALRACRAAMLRNIEACELDAKRVDFIQSLAEDPALLSGKSGLMRYKFDQHGFPVEGCRETATHYVARLQESGIVTHYAKSLYNFQEAIE